MKRLLFFLTAIVLLAIAGAGYWYTTLDKHSVDSSFWLSRSFDDALTIHVQGRQGAYMLRSVAVGWEAEVPGASWNVVARGLPVRVDDFLGKLAELEAVRSTGGFDRGGPEQYGLDAPDLKIIVSFAKSKAEPLIIKMASDGGGTVFGWNSDSPGLVYEFRDNVLETLSRPASQFLDTRVFNVNEEAIDRAQLVQPFGSSWLVEKRKEGYFFMLPGYLKDKPASDSELKFYVHSLALLKADQLLLEPVVTDKQIPALTIKLWEAGVSEPAQVEFFTVDDDPSVYLGKSSWLTVPFTLNSQSVSQLIKSAFDVQGRSVIKLDIGRVHRFIIVHGETNYVVERGASGWRLMDSKKDLPGIDMSLWRFTELQFEALPLNNLPESAVKLMFCKLVDEAGEKLTELTFYADPKLPQGQCWMKNGGGMYYPVSSRLLKDLQGMFPAVTSNGASGAVVQ